MAIKAELSGSSTASAYGIVARTGSPVLELCRRLVAGGVDPTTPLEAYRGKMLCLKVRSIGEAAALEVNSAGTRFIRRPKRRIAPPIRSAHLPATTPAADRNNRAVA